MMLQNIMFLILTNVWENILSATTTGKKVKATKNVNLNHHKLGQQLTNTI